MRISHRISRPAQWSIALAAALVAGHPVSAQSPDTADWVQVYSIVVPYSNDNDLNALTRLLDHAYVDQKARTVSAEVGPGELAQLRMLGLPVQINEAETARIRDYITKGVGQAGLARTGHHAGHEEDLRRRFARGLLPHRGAGLHQLRRAGRQVPEAGEGADPRQDLDGRAVPEARHGLRQQRQFVLGQPAGQVPARECSQHLQPEPVSHRALPDPRDRGRQLREAGRAGGQAAEHGLDRRHPRARIRPAGSRHEVHRVAARQLRDRRERPHDAGQQPLPLHRPQPRRPLDRRAADHGPAAQEHQLRHGGLQHGAQRRGRT